ncbi:MULTISPECIES: MBL fold metallo-hydrolase [unclassified Limnohabitans]|jgi:glyoxylase-like metal-dependent hydrolase (beta-lactamase superfamily II)|uniref:MBL fold metallo-hydrolase n=1 Tax=unclassified Limnohabitans TaxID=2626134 RepID=UPI001E5177D8|nr:MULTISPECIES: MBL fold metallo-hydrolase [unclassified Limnohabitans]
MKRRHMLAASAVCAGVALWPEARLLAQQAQDFIEGPPVGDIPAKQLSAHVWMIFSPDGFPTPENRGMMSNVIFVVTSAGVVVIDSGASLQIGQMAIRMIRKVTDKPVVAVFNSHYHGDHWLGNHAFVKAYGQQLPIYALQSTIDKLKGAEGNLWRGLMERWTNQSTLGTEVVLPNTAVKHGQVIQIGDVTFRMHHYGNAHTPSDLCVEVVQDKLTAVGDIAMANRIANMDEGSYPGTFKYYQALTAATGDQLWVPGHGQGSQDLLKTYGEFMAGIWEPCLQAVKDGKSESEARSMVLKDVRVTSRAKTMQGFEGNIGKYISLAYLEAEKEAF